MALTCPSITTVGDNNPPGWHQIWTRALKRDSLRPPLTPESPHCSPELGQASESQVAECISLSIPASRNDTFIQTLSNTHCGVSLLHNQLLAEVIKCQLKQRKWHVFFFFPVSNRNQVLQQSKITQELMNK